MINKKQKGNVIQMSSAAKKIQIDYDLDSDLSLDEVYAEIQKIRKSKPANFQTRKLVELTSNTEHMQAVFEDGHSVQDPKKTKV